MEKLYFFSRREHIPSALRMLLAHFCSLRWIYPFQTHAASVMQLDNNLVPRRNRVLLLMLWRLRILISLMGFDVNGECMPYRYASSIVYALCWSSLNPRCKPIPIHALYRSCTEPQTQDSRMTDRNKCVSDSSSPSARPCSSALTTPRP